MQDEAGSNLRMAAGMSTPPLPFWLPRKGAPGLRSWHDFLPLSIACLGGGVTGSGGIDRPLIRGMTTGHFRRPGGSS